MAEGLCRHLWHDSIQCESAGVEKHGLNRRAVDVMHEIGIDISQHRSKTVDELESDRFDYVITVCGNANESCPLFPGPARIVHRGFDDPPTLAADAGSEAEALAHYRRVRDEIADFVRQIWQELPAPEAGPANES